MISTTDKTKAILLKQTVAIFVLLLSAVFTFSVLSQTAIDSASEASVKTILLRNVSLIDLNKNTDTVKVNILIKDTKLEIITEDQIPLSEADVSYNVSGGIIIGQLTLGEPAEFLILSGDPRTNIQTLLDTKTYATFAIIKGKVVKNIFATISTETTEEKKSKEKGWLAYTAPPLAFPMSYKNTDKWNRFSNEYVSGIFTGAMVIDRQRWLNQDSDSYNQVGTLPDFDGGMIRALRFGGVGFVNFDRPWIWTIFGATHAFDQGFDTNISDDFTLFDFRLDIPLGDKSSFSVGKQKEPISMERLMPMQSLAIQERASVSDALLPSRNVGLVMAGNPALDNVTIAAGIFNDWIDKDQPSSASDNSTQYVGRVTWVPITSENESTLFHLGAAMRYSTAEEGGRMKSESEFKNSPLFVETDFMTANSSTTYQAEASLRSGPIWLHSEYVRTDVDSPDFNNPTLSGYHVSAMWLLTGEIRPYNKSAGVFKAAPISRNVNQKGIGAWEIAARFSHIDLSEAPDPFGGDAGKMDVWSTGLNWYLTPYFHISMAYRYIILDRNGLEGTSQGFNTRMILMLD